MHVALIPPGRRPVPPLNRPLHCSGAALPVSACLDGQRARTVRLPGFA